MLDASEIRARRKVLKKSPADFAEMLGISRQYLHRIESDRVERISDKLEAKYDALFPTRIFTIRFYRGPRCPICSDDIDSYAKRVYPGKDLENDVYECDVCHSYFTAREAYRVMDEKAQRNAAH